MFMLPKMETIRSTFPMKYNGLRQKFLVIKLNMRHLIFDVVHIDKKLCFPLDKFYSIDCPEFTKSKVRLIVEKKGWKRKTDKKVGGGKKLV